MAEITSAGGSAWPAYRALIVAQWRGQTQYRASFLLDMTMSTCASLLDVLTLLVMFRLTPALGGFDLRAALLMAGLAGCSFSVADLLVGNVDRMRTRIRTGTLDTLLIRPLGVLPQVLASDIGFRRIGRAVQGFLVLALAIWYAHPPLPPARTALLVIAVLSGVLFYAGVFVAGATVAFWWIESGEFAAELTYGGRDFATYPVTVYSGLFRRVFAYGLGFAFIAYYPALALLGRPDPLGLPAWAGWCAPLVAVAAFAAALAVWRAGVRHYRSTGS